MASTIRVDNVQNTPGTNIVNKCSTTVNIGAASDNIRSAGNNLQASDGGNLISQSGTDITLGASGDTINLASGASQSGFGRTGTVDWVTTPKVTGDSPVTAATGSGYFLNTTAGEITINLPAGAAGSIVSMADYAGTWQTNNVIVAANGSEKIGGLATNATLSTEGQSVTFVYVDSTQGWLNTMDSTSNVRGSPPYIVATGGTPCAGATCGDYKIHTFTGPGTLCVSNAGSPPGSTTIDYMVIAGGGGGAIGEWGGGGGGAGGYRESVPSPAAWTGSPIASPGGALPVSVQGYPITVGGGGAGGTANPYQTNGDGDSGSDSIFSSITSAGGGGAGGGNRPTTDPVGPGKAGGSGGGGAGPGGSPVSGANFGAGDTPSTTPDQGFPGGKTVPEGGGAGGGATAAGVDSTGSGPPAVGGAGGAGSASCISGSPVTRGGGGGGSAGNPTCGTAGAGGAGGGGAGNNVLCSTGGAGTVNTGGGAGGQNSSGTCGPEAGGLGGSGIVVIRYKFQN